MSVGCNRKARTCLFTSVAYTHTRHTFGKPLISNQIISHKIDTIARYVESHWAWLERLAYHIQKFPLGWTPKSPVKSRYPRFMEDASLKWLTARPSRFLAVQDIKEEG